MIVTGWARWAKRRIAFYRQCFPTNIFRPSDLFELTMSVTFFLAAMPIPKFWYALPLIVSVSLVYGATRHEHLKPILVHSARSAVWVAGFMLIIFAVIWAAGFWN